MKNSIRKNLLKILAVLPIASLAFAAQGALNADVLDSNSQNTDDNYFISEGMVVEINGRLFVLEQVDDVDQDIDPRSIHRINLVLNRTGSTNAEQGGVGSFGGP